MSVPEPEFADTWLVIPLYNEEEVIGDVVSEVRQTFRNIVCVDDGSSDNSGERAREAGAYVIQHPINLGQGAALQTGITFVLERTNGQYLVTFDADGQHQVSDAVAMVQTARQQDLSIIYGSRFLAGKVEAGFMKRLVLKTAALATRLKTSLKLTDAHNGLRLLRRDAAERIDLKQNRMAHATEIVSQLAATDLKWTEMPVHIRYTEYSKRKGQSLLNSVNIVVELLLG